MGSDLPNLSCSEVTDRLSAMFGKPHEDLGTMRWAVRPAGESVAVHILVSESDPGYPCSVWVFDPRFTAPHPAQRFRVGTRTELNDLIRGIRDLVG